MTTPVLKLDHLAKSYGSVEVLKDICVSMDPGEFLVLLGPSGCGKSTLLNCIAGLIEVTGGDLLIAGKKMNDVPPRDRDIAMVFQSYALYPNMTVAGNIAFGMKVRGVDPATRQTKIDEVAGLLQIGPLLDRKPGQLSGGQRQRVAMGRALVRDPKLFLFDEPLSNLDAKLRVEMRAEIRRLHQTLNASIVYVTHDQIEALTLATRIVVLKDGEVQQIGTPAEVYNRPANVFVADFMGSPPMNLMPATATGTPDGTEIRLVDAQGAPLVWREPRRLGNLETGAEMALTVGLRPEDIADNHENPPAGACIVEGPVQVVEQAGSDCFVVTSLGGKDITARLPANTGAQAGTAMRFVLDVAKASYFSCDTGVRL